MKTYTNPPVALPITESELLALGVPQSAIDAGEMRGEIKHVGESAWRVPVSYKALCVTATWGEHSRRLTETVFGMRTLSAMRSCGYEMEGKVSVNGRKVRGFTSTQLFELPSGRLMNVATIHACLS